MSPAALIATSRDLVAFSTRLVEQRHGFEDSQAAALEELGEQIAYGALRIKLARSKVVYIFDQVMHDPMRNRLAHRAVVQADRNLTGAPVALSGFGDL